MLIVLIFSIFTQGAFAITCGTDSTYDSHRALRTESLNPHSLSKKQLRQTLQSIYELEAEISTLIRIKEIYIKHGGGWLRSAQALVKQQGYFREANQVYGTDWLGAIKSGPPSVNRAILQGFEYKQAELMVKELVAHRELAELRQELNELHLLYVELKLIDIEKTENLFNRRATQEERARLLKSQAQLQVEHQQLKQSSLIAQADEQAAILSKLQVKRALEEELARVPEARPYLERIDLDTSIYTPEGELRKLDEKVLLKPGQYRDIWP